MAWRRRTWKNSIFITWGDIEKALNFILNSVKFRTLLIAKTEERDKKIYKVQVQDFACCIIIDIKTDAKQWNWPSLSKTSTRAIDDVNNRDRTPSKDIENRASKCKKIIADTPRLLCAHVSSDGENRPELLNTPKLSIFACPHYILLVVYNYSNADGRRFKIKASR